NIGGLPQGVIGGTFQFGQNQIPGGSGPVLDLTPCPVATVNFCGNGSLTSKVSGSGWDAGSQAQVAVNVPIPEPTSILLFGSGLAGLGLFSLRRRQKKS